MPLTQAERTALLEAAAVETEAHFAKEVASFTKLTTAEVDALAKTDEEKAALAQVISVVTAATGTNKKRAAAITAISGGVEALVGIAKLVI